MQSENMTEQAATGPEAIAGNKLVGRLFVVMIFAIAILMAGFAVWVKYAQGRRTLELWGTRPTWLIRHAGQVHYIRLSETAEKGKPAMTVSPDKPQLGILSIVDISDRIGLINARHMLIVDRSYRWGLPAEPDPQFSFALEFREGDESIVLLFDSESETVRMQNTDKQAVMGEKLDTLKGYLDFSPTDPLTN